MGVQAAEVGRIISGVFKPIRSVVPSSVHQAVVTEWDTTQTDSDQKSTFYARLGRMPELRSPCDGEAKSAAG
jgi:hypothetical protein